MSPVAPVAEAPAPAPQAREQKPPAPVEFGAAVTHRDLVREKLRVDPAALADRTRAAADVRAREPSRERREPAHELRSEERPPPPGSLVDISV